MCPMGTWSSLTAGYSPVHIARETCPCSDETAFARRDIFKWAYSLGLQLALFSDLGTAWSESDEFSADRFRAGVGAGVRLLAPGAEQVRFDFGWSEAGGFQFHFASGTKPANQRQRLR